MKRIYLLATFLLCMMSPALQAQQETGARKTWNAEQVDSTRAVKGKPSPDFRYPDINGKEYALSDFHSKYVLIDLWTTWCGFCLLEIPDLAALEEKMHGKNIVFVSISLDADKEKWEKYVKDQQLTGLQLYAGNDRSFIDPYEVKSIPRFILIDRQGNVLDPRMDLRPSSPGLHPFLEALEGI
jgi:thiol-disulfide isomerase/thioredoxin